MGRHILLLWIHMRPYNFFKVIKYLYSNLINWRETVFSHREDGLTAFVLEFLLLIYSYYGKQDK